MTPDEFIDYIEKRGQPYHLREKGRAQMASLFRRYPEDLLMECVDIGIAQYFKYDKDGKLIKESLDVFSSKLGGIAHNRSLSPIDQELLHIKNICKSRFGYWNETKANELLYYYVNSLRDTLEWTDSQILNDLRTEVVRATKSCTCWSQWSSTIWGWITYIDEQKDTDKKKNKEKKDGDSDKANT